MPENVKTPPVDLRTGRVHYRWAAIATSTKGQVECCEGITYLYQCVQGCRFAERFALRDGGGEQLGGRVHGRVVLQGQLQVQNVVNDVLEEGHPRDLLVCRDGGNQILELGEAS